jgi:hypothetical protein
MPKNNKTVFQPSFNFGQCKIIFCTLAKTTRMKMKKLITICAVTMLIASAVQASTINWDVATVHAFNEFTISPDSTSLLYHQQGWTDYAWSENNGSAPGTLATGMYGNRTGMKTYAATDVAKGQTISSLKLAFDYHNTLGLYPSINFFLTDGLGHYGIFSPASGGVTELSTSVVNGEWTTMTFDFTSVKNDAINVAIYEHNGLSSSFVYPYTSMQWGDIKNLTIAGMYDYQRSPEGGWDAWGTTMFDGINHAGSTAAVDNGFGVALVWGDTVNSNNSYGSAQREIRNVTLSFGGTDYNATFVNVQAPEPGTFVLLGMGGLTAMFIWRRRRS